MTINDNIKAKLPYLDLTNANVLSSVETTKIEVFVILEVLLGKPDDTTYTDKEKLLATYYVCYLLLFTKTVETLAGNASVGSGEVTANVFTKKEKADVVEQEYDLIKATDGANISLETEKLMAFFKDMACKIANSLGFDLPICDCAIDLLPFKYYYGEQD